MHAPAIRDIDQETIQQATERFGHLLSRPRPRPSLVALESTASQDSWVKRMLLDREGGQ